MAHSGRILTRWTFLAVAAALATPATAHAQAALHEDFESPMVSWQAAGSDASYRVERHVRAVGQAHSGHGSEHLALSCGPGSFIHFVHNIGQARIISELSPSVWVKSDRAGAQLAARVAFPRTRDPATGRPLTALVRGAAYSRPGQWQRLAIADVPTLVERQVRVLRAQFGPSIDAREAYLDQIVLNVYSGPGRVNVWMDDLEVTGFVGQRPGAAAADASGAGAADRAAAPPIARTDPADPPADSRRIVLDGSVLVVDGRPFCPRLVDHRGESLWLLRSLGFNTVHVGQPPTAEFLGEARRAGMWVVCPPPAELDDIGPQFDPVLAWTLGFGLTGRKLQETTLLAQRVRLADRRQPRPLIAGAEEELRAYSRVADVLVLRRSVLGTSLELPDFVEWLRGRARLARPGAIFWHAVETQPAPELAGQLVALSGRKAVGFAWDREQIRAAAFAAVAGGGRGLWFRSYDRLDGDDPASRRRAIALSAVSAELALLDAWVAQGQPFDVSGTGASASAPATRASTTGRPAPPAAAAMARDGLWITVLKNNGGDLLLASRAAAGSQCAPAPAPNPAVALVIPGSPEERRPYELSVSGVRALSHRRTAGGTAVTLDEFGVSGLVVCTGDPLLLGSLSRATAEARRRASALELELARSALDETVDVLRRTPGGEVRSGRWLDAARASLAESARAAASANHALAFRHAQRAGSLVGVVRRVVWEQAAATVRSPVVSPLATSFATTPDHWALWQRLRDVRPGDNVLPAGECDSLEEMLAAGWRHFRRTNEGAIGDVELVPDAPYSGQACLRLTVRPANPADVPELLQTPPTWVASPSVSVAAGTLVRISGKVRLKNVVRGGEGLVILDSVGGAPLALRIRPAESWQDFELYRAVDRRGAIGVTIVLDGLGEAWVDRLAIEPLLALVD